MALDEHGMLQVPWTKEQAEEINAFQRSGVFHPFTCRNEDCRAILTACENGWYCPVELSTGIQQTWCWGWMADGDWRKAIVPGVHTE